ncbi:hypothetical protein, partial [Chryseobacterium flavum]|uniref:hypothetical protein n=1 Tax=Chryseobacterium flavum TaxID=415851 RepID=UPI002FDB1BB7
MKKLLLILLIFGFKLFNSQNPVVTIFPSNPEISSILNSTSQNINLSQGLPNIIIPIYTIKQGNINYPVNISYKSGGVKVDEISSSVGLGWSINAKSFITRVVKDLPDDVKTSGYMYTPYTINKLKLMVNTVEGSNELSVSKSLIDAEPDEFIINIPESQIKFYYDRENNAFFQAPLSDIKIKPGIDISSGQITTWEVIYPDGTKYYFGHNSLTEKSTLSSMVTINNSGAEGNSSSGGDHITSWYLWKIEDSNNKTIEFEYEDEIPYNYYTKIEESKIVDYSGSGGMPVPYQRIYSSRRIQDKILKNILADNTKVVFNLSPDNRLDQINTKALSSIDIRQYNNKNKSVEFSYSYFNADSSYDFDNYNGMSGPPYRLKLNELLIYNGQSLVPEKYTFKYNEITNLPRRNSYSQDAWGFFNGKHNISLVPQVNANYIINGMNGFWGDSDRSISLSHTEANTLNKIYFPTGGNVTYTYELNDASVVTNLSYPFNFSPLVDRNQGLFADVIQTPDQTVVSDRSEYIGDEFEIKELQGSVYINTQIEGCTSNFNNSNCAFNIKIINTQNNNVLNITQPILNISLPKGNYRIVANKNSIYSQPMAMGFMIGMQWKETESGSDLGGGFVKVGGLRISSYRLDDNNQIIQKNFTYTKKLENNNIVSSGLVRGYPLFILKPYYNTSGNSFKISSNIITPLINNLPIVYEYVTEEFTGNKGKIISEFSISNKSDLPAISGTLEDDFSNFYMSWRDNLLKRKVIYNSLGERIQETVNTYQSNKLKIKDNFGGIFQYRYADVNGIFYKYQFYPILTEQYILSASKTTNYLSSQPIEASVEYFYNGTEHYNISKQKEISPDNTIQETTYSYAHEKGNQLMIEKNMI